LTTFKSTPENEAKRLRAYELFVSATTDGKRRSIRSISQELGVSLSTVQYWRDHDNWERRVREAMLSAGQAAEMASSHVKMALRKGLLEGIDQLHSIITKGDNREKILAFKALVDTSVRLRAVDFGTGEQPPPEWTDEVTDPALEETPANVG
jgi:hypothetical protein